MRYSTFRPKMVAFKEVDNKAKIVTNFITVVEL